jgi:hypothetical protein
MERAKWNRYCDELEEDFAAKAKGSPRTENWTVPFIPWCGDNYFSAKPRIMFVGKSVGLFECWKELLSSGRSSYRNLTDEYVREKVALCKSRSNFWTVPFLIAGALLPEIQPKQIANSIAWSNLYKVNIRRDKDKKDGLPQPEDLQKCRETLETCSLPCCLKHYSAKCLQKEIQILTPDILLLGIGKSWNDLDKTFQGSTREKRANGPPMRLTKNSQLTGAKAVWITYHFSQWDRSPEHGKLIWEFRKALEERT